MACDQLVSTCVGCPNGEKRASFELDQSQCNCQHKSKQVGGQTKRKLNASWDDLRVRLVRTLCRVIFIKKLYYCSWLDVLWETSSKACRWFFMEKCWIRFVVFLTIGPSKCVRTSLQNCWDLRNVCYISIFYFRDGKADNEPTNWSRLPGQVSTSLCWFVLLIEFD